MAWTLPERALRVDPQLQFSTLTWPVTFQAYALSYGAFAASCAAAALFAGRIVTRIGVAGDLGIAMIASTLATITLARWTSPELRLPCDAIVLFLGLLVIATLVSSWRRIAASKLRYLVAAVLLFVWMDAVDPRPVGAPTSFPWWSLLGHVHTRYPDAKQVASSDAGWLSYLLLAWAATPPTSICAAPAVDGPAGRRSLIVLVPLAIGFFTVNAALRESIDTRQRQHAVAEQQAADEQTCLTFRSIADEEIAHRHPKPVALDTSLKMDIDRAVEAWMASLPQAPHVIRMRTYRCPWGNFSLVDLAGRTALECSRHGHSPSPEPTHH